MPCEVLYRKLMKNERMDSFELFLLVQCAPLLTGIRASHTLMLTVREIRHAVLLFGKLGIEYYILAESGEKILVFFYRRNLLEACLHRPGVLQFLSRYGYEEKNVFSMLASLSRRMGGYQAGAMDFPHEMGLFLGYPLPDVKLYTEKKGSGALLTGYWKVYTSPGEAKETFRKYDAAKEEMIKGLCILAGEKADEPD